jgi:predicted helicase
MSITRINQYYNEIHEAQQFSGSKKETSIRRYFADLLNFFAKEKHLRLVDEIKIPNSTKQPDGVLIDIFRHRYGYWEAKDLQDDFEKELNQKIKIGYPTDNLLFENSQKAMLIRGDMREICDMTDAKALKTLLEKFINFERKEAKDFKEAVEFFKRDVGDVARVLKKMMEGFIGNEQNLIDTEKVYNKEFVAAHTELFMLCKLSINPNITKSDINEMVVQHILTGDIFRTVFGDAQYLDENNIAMALNKIEKTFFTGDLKRNTLKAINPYYQAIKGQASALLAHEEKQDFLKTIYENFYQAYNSKGADKLGIVYTPSEIVNFMLDTTDYLLEKHFDKTLSDKNVHILDPATGTGTFITHLIKKLSPHTLEHKYEHELHANEVSILPYYIANLNIEYIYQQKMQQYRTFKNICWVDTLDNTDALEYKNQQKGLFKDTSMLENYQRIQNQNNSPLTVIIGNPPYNANQQNENDNNKNREYYFNYAKKEGGIDGRIKETYVEYSNATKTKVYDMYARFYRWATDRMTNAGIVAFVTNRSFIDSGTYDGFRKCIKEDFNEIHIVDLKGDVRAAGDTTQGGNVFNIMTGVAMMFLIKNKELDSHRIYYYNLGDGLTGKEKLEILKYSKLKNLVQEKISPDKNHNWINLSASDFKTLLPLVESDDKNKAEEKLVEFSGVGINTARDEWVFDFSKKNLLNKITFFAKFYNAMLQKYFVADGNKIWKQYLKKHKDKNGNGKNGNGKPQLVNVPEVWGEEIKWSESLKNYFLRNDLLKNKLIKVSKNQITEINYRPFVKQFYYNSQILSDRLTQKHYAMFGEGLDKENKVICFTSPNSQKPFMALVVDKIMDLHFTSPATNTFSIPFYTYLENGERVENITDWGLAVFQKTYSPTQPSPQGGLKKEDRLKNSLPAGRAGVGLNKLDIFHYIYAVLHSPAYRKMYELDLKREFPRIPLYADFWKYVEAGKKLMELHLNYENSPTPNPSPQGGEFVSPPFWRGLGGATPLLKRKDIDLAEFLEKLRGKKKEKELFSKEKTALFEEEVKEPEIKINTILKIKDDIIFIDELTTLSGVPAQALAYKLGNRSAIEWVLDQYKPYKSDDKTIQEYFNTYKFEDYKEEVIELLQKVTWVSVETMKIVGEL